MREPVPPARRRLRRVRWSMTIAFAAVTALALLVLAAVTLHLDDEARQRDAQDAVLRDAAQVSLMATDQGLDLKDYDSEVAEQRPSCWAVVSQGVLLVAGPDARSAPTDAVLAQTVADAQTTTLHGTTEAVPDLFVAPDERGVPVSWEAEAGTGVAGAAVPPHTLALLGEPVPRAAEHARLTGELLLAALPLALAAGT